MHYRHDREPEWLSKFNVTTGEHTNTNFDNLGFSLKSTEDLLIRWGTHSALAAFEPVNEPLWTTPLEPLFDFYRESRALTRRYAPQAKFVFHDSFRFEPSIWNELFRADDSQDTILDHHFYWAFAHQGGDMINSVGETCAYVEKFAAKAAEFHYDVWFGEWALATDNCALFLNGLNDGEMKPGTQCAQMSCPKPYLPAASAVDVDRDAAILGPFGSLGDNSYNSIKEGQCWTDSLFYSQLQVKFIAQCAYDSYDKHIQGQFLWTAKNEIEARWDYIRAWDMGWLNTTEVPESQQLDYPDFVPYVNASANSEEL